MHVIAGKAACFGEVLQPEFRKYAQHDDSDDSTASLSVGGVPDRFHCFGCGKTGDAIRCFEAALKAKPDYPEANNHLGLALVRSGQTGEGVRQFQEALRLKPDYAGAHKNLEDALAAKDPASPPPGAA